VSRSPHGSTFSAKITPAITAIQTRLITPRLKRTIISPQQQPTPVLGTHPHRSDPALAAGHVWARAIPGERVPGHRVDHPEDP